jgi:hypothetical protein
VAFTIRSVEYYYANVRDELGAAYRFLAQLAELGVDLLAFTAVPSGPTLAQFTLVPADARRLVAQARAANLPLDGPHDALLVQGDDGMGALAGSTSVSSTQASTFTRLQVSQTDEEHSATSSTSARTSSRRRSALSGSDSARAVKASLGGSRLPRVARASTSCTEDRSYLVVSESCLKPIEEGNLRCLQPPACLVEIEPLDSVDLGEGLDLA